MAKYRSSKLTQKKKKKFRLKLVLILGVFIFLIVSLSVLSKCDFLNIKEIKIDGNKIVKKEDLNKKVEEKLVDNYFWLFPKRNVLIYPKQTLKTTIIESFPWVQQVDLDLDLPNILNINITERKPYVLWCEKTSITKCYFVDNEGYVFSNLNSFEEKEMFRYYTDSNIPIRENIFSFGKFKEIDSFVKFIGGLGLMPYKFVQNGKKYEIFFGNQNSKIIFDNNQDVKEIVNNLQSVLNMEEFSDIEDLKKLEYIDLRFGNKVFYK